MTTPGTRNKKPEIEIRVVTYNIHRCIGRDGLCRPARIAHILKALDADVVALQEVDTSTFGDKNSLDQLEYLARATGFVSVAGPTIYYDKGYYGNALLTRHPMTRVNRVDLSVRPFEPRGMIDVDLAIAEFPELRIAATHLGLRRRERRRQMEILVDHLDRSQKPLIVTGDFNEWHRFGYSMRVLDRIMGRNVSVRSYPACLPVVALDRIWVQPAAMLRRTASVKTPLTCRSSDHLPVVADVAWRGE